MQLFITRDPANPAEFLRDPSVFASRFSLLPLPPKSTETDPRRRHEPSVARAPPLLLTMVLPESHGPSTSEQCSTPRLDAHDETLDFCMYLRICVQAFLLHQLPRLLLQLLCLGHVQLDRIKHLFGLSWRASCTSASRHACAASSPTLREDSKFCRI